MCDPFVVLFMQPNKLEIFESKIINKTLNPNFDQMFEFTSLLPQEIRLQTLVFRVYDHDRFSKNVIIGECMYVCMYRVEVRLPGAHRAGEHIAT